MTLAVEQLVHKVRQLSPAEQQELANELFAELAPADIAQAQIAEVRRRIAEVESGTVQMIPAGQVART